MPTTLKNNKPANQLMTVNKREIILKMRSPTYMNKTKYLLVLLRQLAWPLRNLAKPIRYHLVINKARIIITNRITIRQRIIKTYQRK